MDFSSIEIAKHIPTAIGYLTIAVSALDGIKKWWDGEFSKTTSILSDEQEKRVSGFIGGVARLLGATIRGLSAFNTRK